jgi:enamine deaminase RidA (YjgF/YER057c/UK114 family)
MKYEKIAWEDLAIEVIISSLDDVKGDAEHHAVIHLRRPELSAEVQYQNMAAAEARLRKYGSVGRCTPVWKRYFVSDGANWERFSGDGEDSAAMSVIRQPPLDGTEVTLWVYFVENGRFTRDSEGLTVLDRNTYKHLYHTQLHTHQRKGALAETEAIFETCAANLRRYRCTMKDHCLRTWIFVRDIDRNYADMVRARKAFFDREGLTSATHYIASTGIEGCSPSRKTLIQMDAYSVQGILHEQIKYLHVPTHLSPTDAYGVTFERGTVATYGDRRHVFISGTASIDRRGEIVHPGDLARQIDRTMENVFALLAEAGAGGSDVAQMIVYLRNREDYRLAEEYFEGRYADVPRVIVWGAVCRPGWLVEVECVALCASGDCGFEGF